ncbi:hypothetical protein NL676_025830 [Syzygium grande]|nr:hypothetical protein NL676_025830 [Syzygium grande]
MLSHMASAVVHLPKKRNPPLADSIEKMKEFFRRCDANGDGRLNWAELKTAFQKLGMLVPGSVLSIVESLLCPVSCVREQRLMSHPV